jgi:hypothetical protein
MLTISTLVTSNLLRQVPYVRAVKSDPRYDIKMEKALPQLHIRVYALVHVAKTLHLVSLAPC